MNNEFARIAAEATAKRRAVMVREGNRLRAMLGRLGISQCEAARRCGVVDRTMRRYIAGEIRIPDRVWVEFED